jgi:hypothetical protein
MDHVSSHRGKDISTEGESPSFTASIPLTRTLTCSAVMQKLNIVNDHVVDDKEGFELNLYPTKYNSESETSSVKSAAAPLSRAPTRTSIVDSLWSRKPSTATNATNLDTGPALQRTSTWRSELSRTDSVVEGAIEEEGQTSNIATSSCYSVPA